jgi:hypothetical protein
LAPISSAPHSVQRPASCAFCVAACLSLYAYWLYEQRRAGVFVLQLLDLCALLLDDYFEADYFSLQYLIFLPKRAKDIVCFDLPTLADLLTFTSSLNSYAITLIVHLFNKRVELLKKGSHMKQRHFSSDGTGNVQINKIWTAIGKVIRTSFVRNVVVSAAIMIAALFVVFGVANADKPLTPISALRSPIYTTRVAVGTANVRYCPSMSCGIVYHVHYGIRVHVYFHYRGWASIGPNRWIASYLLY